MNLDIFELKETAGRGKGIFAKRYIKAGTVLGWQCPDCEILNDDALTLMNAEDRSFYWEHCYRNKEKQLVLPCGHFKYMNHSCDANIFPMIDHDVDVAVRDINIGEEATYDYRVFYDDNEAMTCKCGSHNCCGIVTCVKTEQLKQFWNNKRLKTIEAFKKLGE